MVLLLALACKGPSTVVPPTTDSPTDPPPIDCSLPIARSAPIGALPIPEQRLGLAIRDRGTATVTGDFSLATDGSTTVTLPATLWIAAAHAGTGTLTIEGEVCGTQTVELTGRIDPGLSAALLPAAPGHTWVNAFGTGATVRAALDPARWPRLAGEVDVYRIPHASWDGTLADVRGAPTTVTVNGLTLVELGTIDTPPSTLVHEDLVVDVDRDGRFGPGDYLDGASVPGLTAFPDLAEGGPYLTEHGESDAGFFRTQRVWWPTGIDAFDEPRPVVVISHGNGHEYNWYDDLQQHLASWGYVVMSHRSDTEPGIQAASTTLLDNTDRFLTSPGQVDAALTDRIDPTRVAWIGHSRGGEAVAMGVKRLRDGFPTETLDIDALRLVSSIAPTVFNSPTVSDVGDRPFHLLLGGADGDVTQGPITPGLPFRCDLCKSSRLLQTSTDWQAVSYLQGAIHNDFNCCGMDDGAFVASPKIGRAAAQRYTRAVYAALLAFHLDGEPHALEFLQRMPGSLPLPDTGQPVSVLTRPAQATATFVEDFQTEPSDVIASSGAAVTHDLDDYVEDQLRDANLSYTYLDSDPMNGMTQSEGEPGIAARGAVFSVQADSSWEVALPAGIAPEHRALAVRIAQSTRHPLTVALDDSFDFSIALVGSSGATVVATAAYGTVPAPYRRGGAGTGIGWANEFSTVRIPLVDFETAGADLSDVVAIRLSFGPSFGSATGRIAIDDLVLEP